MSMYSKTNVLKKSSFYCIMHMLNIVLWGRQRQTLNGYFSVNNGNICLILNCNETADTRLWFIKNDDKRLSIDGEKRVFDIKATFSNLPHPQFCIEDKVLKL